MRREEAQALWREAEEQAQRDLANLKARGLMNDDDARAEEAMLVTLTIMRSPMNQDLQARAARQVLEWTLPKPKARVKLTVDLAETWLASLDAAEQS